MNCYKPPSLWSRNALTNRTTTQARRLLTVFLGGNQVEIDAELRRSEEACRVHAETTHEMEQLEAFEEAIRELRKASNFDTKRRRAHIGIKGAIRLLEILAYEA